jgi:hypothetical protein
MARAMNVRRSFPLRRWYDFLVHHGRYPVEHFAGLDRHDRSDEQQSNDHHSTHVPLLLPRDNRRGDCPIVGRGGPPVKAVAASVAIAIDLPQMEWT